MRPSRTDDPVDPIADLRANLYLLRCSVERMTEAMKGILHEMRSFDARLSTLEAGLGDPAANKNQCASKPVFQQGISWPTSDGPQEFPGRHALSPHSLPGPMSPIGLIASQ
ncbi:hypothetical protein ACQP1O_12365 [Nocardia sp. CA-151230]|uniref:hypothetical protein n=1 Tax=Nocardia sp. CA-151230 TaxID=3239982 RepID=UPI003D8DC02E